MKNAENILLKPAINIQRRFPANLISEDISAFSDEYSYKTYDTYLKFIENARVSPDSVVYQKGFLVDETVSSNRYKSYYRLKHLLKKILTGKKVSLNDNKKYLLVTDLESAGHFHWFTEALPKLFCIRDFADEFVLLLPDSPYIRKIATDSLELLRLNFENFVLMKETEFYKIKNLYYISRISRTGQMHDEIMKEMNKVFLAGKKTGNNRIYISRKKARFRKILNEEELTDVLKNYGFEILHAEDFSFSEQIDIFSTCGTLLGIHGAGLTNCFFMNQGSNVIELRRKETVTNNGYWHLTDSLDHKYYYYNGIPDSEKSIIGHGCNLTIPVSHFENEILKQI